MVIASVDELVDTSIDASVDAMVAVTVDEPVEFSISKRELQTIETFEQIRFYKVISGKVI